MELSPGAVEYLRSRDWPGNIRELQNTIERAAVLCVSRPVNGEELRRTKGNMRGTSAGQEGFLELGGYPRRVKSSEASHDADAAARLWSVSEELTGVRYLSEPEGGRTRE
jgi:DNA-binding NtrC family response regulator